MFDQAVGAHTPAHDTVAVTVRHGSQCNTEVSNAATTCVGWIQNKKILRKCVSPREARAMAAGFAPRCQLYCVGAATWTVRTRVTEKLYIGYV